MSFKGFKSAKLSPVPNVAFAPSGEPVWNTVLSTPEERDAFGIIRDAKDDTNPRIAYVLATEKPSVGLYSTEAQRTTALCHVLLHGYFAVLKVEHVRTPADLPKVSHAEGPSPAPERSFVLKSADTSLALQMVAEQKSL